MTSLDKRLYGTNSNMFNLTLSGWLLWVNNCYNHDDMNIFLHTESLKEVIHLNRHGEGRFSVRYMISVLWKAAYEVAYEKQRLNWIIVWQRFSEPCQTKNCRLSVCKCVCVCLVQHLTFTIAISICFEPSHAGVIYYSLFQILLTIRSVHFCLLTTRALFLVDFYPCYPWSMNFLMKNQLFKNVFRS